ncbi:MAG: hypothetical protein HY279_08870 [Nitrospinae bacterium]|nr:hypothetical protein [Nitrospinota bacterium]
MVNIKGIFDALSNPPNPPLEKVGEGGVTSIKITQDITLDLKIGQILSGEVVKAIDSSNALVRFGEFEIIANTTKGLTAGEPLVVRVESLNPQIVMKLLELDLIAEDKLLSLLKKLPIQKIDIGKSIENITKIIANLPDTDHAPEIITKFKEVLSSIPLKLSERLAPEDVRRTIQLSGGFYENKIHKLIEGGEIAKESVKELKGDIKGQLLMLLKDLDLIRGEPPPRQHLNKEIGLGEFSLKGILKEKFGIRDLEIGLKNLLSSIESHQAVNSLSQKPDNSFMLQIPYMAQDGFRTLKLYIKDQKEKKGEGKLKEEYNLVFILDMVNTGMMRADVSVRKKNVHCRINVEREDVALFFRQFLPDLVKGLSEGDIKATADCTVAMKEFIMEEPVQEFLKVGNFQLVDTRV